MALPIDKDLAQILIATAAVASAIRANAGLLLGDRNKQGYSPVDSMWLAESLHNLNYFGWAVKSGDPKKIAAAAERQAGVFESYFRPDHPGRESIERWGMRPIYAEAIDALRRIAANSSVTGDPDGTIRTIRCSHLPVISAQSARQI